MGATASAPAPGVDSRESWPEEEEEEKRKQVRDFSIRLRAESGGGVGTPLKATV